MKLIVVPPLRLNQANGARTRTLEIYTRLTSQFEITFLVDRADESIAEKHYLELLNNHRKVNAYTGKNPVKLLQSFMNVVREARRMDAVICYANYWASVLSSYLVARLSRRPLVITIHIIEKSARRKGYFMKKAFDYCSCLLAMDNGRIVEELKALFPGKPVFPIINGVDYDIYSSGEYPGEKVADCIFVGVLTERKGERDLVEIWRHIKEVRPGARLQILAGVTRKRRVEAFLDIARENGIGEEVSIVGYISDEAKIEALRRSSIFVLPSRDEGMALVIPEALAAGLPVVMWDLPPFVGIKKGVIKVPYRDINGFAKEVLRLLSDDEYRNSLGREAQLYAKSVLSWDAAATLEASSIVALKDSIEKSTPSTSGVMQ